MAGRGPQSFHKRQKEQARKEKQQQKLAKRLDRSGDTQSSDDDGIGTLLEDGTYRMEDGTIVTAEVMAARLRLARLEEDDASSRLVPANARPVQRD